MAIALAEAGADVVGVSASLKPGSETEKKVKAVGRNFWSYSADLTSREPATMTEDLHGVGRELFAMFRTGADSAEHGASAMLAAGGL